MYSQKDFAGLADIFSKNVPGIKALYLFGSYARGDARENSDVDVAAIVHEQPTGLGRQKLLNTLYAELRSRRMTADIVFKPEREFNQDKQLSVTLSHTIASEGKILWKTNEYTT